MKLITENKPARFEYFVEDAFEAGIKLDGGEVKSIRAGNVNMNDSFCFLRDGEVVLKNMHVAVYDKAGAFNSKDSRRDRKLLLHKYQIHKLEGKVREKGYTLVPLKLYFKDALIKVEVGLCRGKQLHDKKKALAERDIKRAAEREIKEYFR